MKKSIILLSILFAFQTISKAQFEFAGKIVSCNKTDQGINFRLSNSLFNIYVVADNIVRFRYTNHKSFSTGPSYAVIYKQHKVPFNFEDKKDYFEVATSALTIKISKVPCRVSIYDKYMNLINEDEKSFGVAFDKDEVRCFKTLFNNEKFYGLGEKTGDLSRRGNQYTMWNSDIPGYSWTQDPLYQSIPFFIGIRNNRSYGIFFDNTYKSYFNMGASNNRFYWFGADKGEMNYYFIYGLEIKKVISSYTDLTGKMELPPKWALGYQQSKWSYYPESTVRSLANTFRNKQIPCDVIYLDIDYMNGYRVFTWNKERFPEPEKMLSDLKMQGFKVVTIIDPGVKADTDNYSVAKEGLNQNLFVKYPDGEFYQGEVWPSWAYFPDFTKKTTRDWWGRHDAELIKQGVSGLWNDMNEPSVWGQAFPDIVQFDNQGFGANHKKIHNVYGLEMARATFDGIKNNVPNTRPFILTRAGYAGIQRYAAVWTGDNVANDVHLKMACTITQSLGLSGIPFVGSDVGGFIGVPSGNLYTRWMELGAFTPFFRGHSEINIKDKEPWAFGAEVEGWVKKAIELRYRLLPYLYSEFYKASISGLPIMRPMFLDFQDDGQCYTTNAEFQFMLGNEILVAPVLNENDVYKKVYLPEGKWLELQTNKIYNGKQWVVVEAPIDRIPFFIKEGGIVPMQEVQNYIGEKKIKELKLNIFPSGKSSSYELYEDDGKTLNYQNGDFTLTKFEVTHDKGLDISIKKEKDNYNTGRKDYLINIFEADQFSKISSGSSLLLPVSSLNNLENSGSGYFYDAGKKILTIKIDDTGNLKIVCR